MPDAVAQRRKTSQELTSEKVVEGESFCYKLLIEHSRDGIVVLDRDGKVHEANRRFADMLGYSPQEVRQLYVWDWDHQFTRDRLLEMIRIVDESGDYFQTRHRRKDGGLIDVEISSNGTSCGGRKLVFCVCRDVTERLRMMAERERLKAAIEHAGETVVITDRTGTIQYVNPAFERITGYSRAEAMGQNPRILKSGKQNEAFYRDLWQTITDGRIWTGRIVNRRKDGTLYTEEANISPVREDPSGAISGFVAVKRDISKDLELEQRVSQAQKMEAIGALAGGIAHDFNNILFPIMGLAEMLIEDLPADGPERESVAQIYTAARRASDLVKQILAFSRQVAHQKIPVRIQQILKEIIKLTRSTIPSNIEVVNALQADCGMVLADPVQVHQIAMNLITNAFHACEAQAVGRISIRLKEVDLSAGAGMQLDLRQGRYAMLSVVDNGGGIDPEVLDKIFEPYFTTKPQGKGTGLGLAVVYGIVKEHGGAVRVDRTSDGRTVFDVFLPILEAVADAFPPTQPGADPTGHERILLVDDEAPIVRLESLILERLGYAVVARNDSLEALETFRADPQAFDLVITDLTMPNLTGDRLAASLLAIRPDLPIVVCTGFSEKIDAVHAEQIGIRGFLTKPVVKSDLARMVRKALKKK